MKLKLNKLDHIEQVVDGIQLLIDYCKKSIENDRKRLENAKKGIIPNYIGKSNKEKPAKKRGRPKAVKNVLVKKTKIKTK